MPAAQDFPLRRILQSCITKLRIYDPVQGELLILKIKIFDALQRFRAANPSITIKHIVLIFSSQSTTTLIKPTDKSPLIRFMIFFYQKGKC